MQLFSSRTWLASLTMAAGLCCSTVAMAQPANNVCATVAAGGFDIPAAGGTVTGTTALATPDGDCSCDNGTAGRDVYYRFTPATTTVWRLSLCAGTTIDTVMSIHSACPADTTTQIACDDDGCGTIGGPSRVQTTLNAGTTYLIRVGMWSSTAAGGAFSLVVAPQVALTNDDCATVSASGPSIPGAGGTVTGTTEDATVDGDCSCDDGDSGIDVYYRFTPATTGNWQFALCTGTTIDTTLSIHSGCPADQSTEIACDDDGCGQPNTGVPSRVSASLSAGTTYLIRVGMWDSFDTAGGPFTLTATNLDQNGACCAPDGSCSVGQLGNCISPSVAQAAGSTCTVNPCPQPPVNDECSGALALTAGTPSNGTITLANGAAITGGCTGSNIDVWYTFTPAVTSNYQVTTTPATGTDAATAITVGTVCPQGSTADYIACSAQPAPGGANTLTFLGAAGSTYYVRLGGFIGNIGNFSVVVNSITLGACCSAATGACTTSSSGAAGCGAGSTYLGDNTGCVPSPCVSQACCNAATGVCSVVGTDPCPSGTTGQGAGTSCTVNPCPQPPAPANDNCSDTVAANAPQIPGVGGIVAGSNVSATDDGTGSCTAGHRDVYFLFTPATSGAWQFDTCATVPSFDTTISIHSACPADASTELACNDDSCGLLSSVVATGLTGGVQVIVRVGSFSAASPGGAFTLTVAQVEAGACCNAATGVCTTTNAGAAGCLAGTTYQGAGTSCTPSNPCPQPPPPANDDCASAQALTLNVAFTGTNAAATGDGTEGPGGACYFTSPTTFGKAVWFTFTAPATDVFGITACGTTFDTVLSVFDGTCAAFGSELGCDDDTCDGVTPPGSGLASVIVSQPMTAGQTYLIRLASWNNNAGGAYSMTVTGTAPAGGVCCRGATCNTTIATAAACSASLVPGQTAGATFVSTSTACNTTGNNTSPCCYANYNKAGGIGVQDIFDFLNDWFAGSAYANVGGNGTAAPLAVQNIFDFLNAWFAGGCS